MTVIEAHEAIIKEIEAINFCGHCLEMKCEKCEKEEARKESLRKMREDIKSNMRIVELEEEKQCNHKFLCINEYKITPKNIRYYLNFGFFPIRSIVCVKCGKQIPIMEGKR